VRRTLLKGTVVIALVVASACATGRAVSNGKDAVKRGDWDSAVVYYRQALADDPGRVVAEDKVGAVCHAERDPQARADTPRPEPRRDAPGRAEERLVGEHAPLGQRLDIELADSDLPREPRQVSLEKPPGRGRRVIEGRRDVLGPDRAPTACRRHRRQTVAGTAGN